MDPYSGHSLHSTWSKPQQFAQLIRNAGAYAAAAAAESSDYDGGTDCNEYGHDADHRNKKYIPKSKTIFESNDEEDDDYGEIIEEDEEKDAEDNYEDENYDDEEEYAEEVEEDC